MRIDPTVFGTVGLIGVIAIAATAAASIVSSATTSIAIVAGAAFVSMFLGVRAVRGMVGGNAERLATTLPDHLRAALEAPPVDVTTKPAVHSDVAAAPAPGACPRCQQQLGDAGGAFHQRECAQGCGALVLDSERLLVDRAGLDLEVVRALVREQGVKKGVCPSCASAMHEGKLRGLIVDVCLSCGALWLDQREIPILSRENAFGGAA